MNCANHPDAIATAYCRSCGKALCQSCQRPVQGTVFCEEHAGAAQGSGAAAYSPYTTPYTAEPASLSASPGLAFLLGIIPGVGAIYNGQYAKGLIHVIVLGTLISIISSGAANGFEPVFGLLIGLWFFYMAFEAMHTANKRLRGEPVDEFSSLIPARAHSASVPLGPILMILIGVSFLLNNLEIIRFWRLMRWWPVFLIVLGFYLLYTRLTARVIAPREGFPRE